VKLILFLSKNPLKNREMVSVLRGFPFCSPVFGLKKPILALFLQHNKHYVAKDSGAKGQNYERVSINDRS